ncbi:MAG TPA: PEGA domain-containing protein [Kofleriaceae bacterium]|nr:PEGA domain-containing protein [Kofleriaceae bacterium]
MGDAALKVQTRFATAVELLKAVGTALERGSLRLPLPLKFETPFKVTLVAANGAEAVRGTAEIVEHAGHATWIRFLSAGPELPGDDASRCMLADVDVDVTGPQEAVVEPAASSTSEAFDAITAVNDRPPALASMMGTAEVVPLVAAPPEPQPTVAATEAPSAELPGSIADAVRSVEASEASTAPIPVETMAEVVASSREVVAVVDDRSDVSSSTGAAVSVVTEDAEAIYVNEKRDTEASPPLVVGEHLKDSVAAERGTEPIAAHTIDAVAAERGIEPIAEPYVRESLPVVPQAMPTARRIVIASVSFAAVCMAVSMVALVWAHDAVAEAETKPTPASTPVVEADPVEAVADVEAAPVVEAAPAVEQVADEPTPSTCTLEIDASVAESRVKIDGKDRGLSPTTISVPCGQPVDVEVRHARYATYERTITVTGVREALRAKLERDKTTVTLTSDPPATVTLDGHVIGKTPMTTTVSRFEQSTFRFSAPGYESDWRRILPKTGASSVVLTLKPQR